MKTVEELKQEYLDADAAWKAAVDSGTGCKIAWKTAVYAYKRWKEARDVDWPASEAAAYEAFKRWKDSQKRRSHD